MSKNVFEQGTSLHALDQFSFSDEAARLAQKAHPDLHIVHEKAIDGVAAGINQGELGILPFENSSSGVVMPHFDMLCRNMWQIVADVSLKVRMCVGANQAMDLQQATRVRSHPKALEQSSFFLEQLPNLREQIGASSTADAAQHLAQHPDPEGIVLASRLAISSLGLTLVDSDVANLKGEDNVTQFFVVRKRLMEVRPEPDQRFHAAIINPQNVRGVLRDVTKIISDGVTDLRSLHSRTVGEKRYNFFVEMERQGSPEAFDTMTQSLDDHPHISGVQWLGSWDESFHSA